MSNSSLVTSVFWSGKHGALWAQWAEVYNLVHWSPGPPPRPPPQGDASETRSTSVIQPSKVGKSKKGAARAKTWRYNKAQFGEREPSCVAQLWRRKSCFYSLSTLCFFLFPLWTTCLSPIVLGNKWRSGREGGIEFWLEVKRKRRRQDEMTEEWGMKKEGKQRRG